MGKQLTLSSLFDGIGGWLLAAKHNGIQPMWSSEIDPYPAAVSKFHFPNVTQYGDVTKINGADVEPTDILCAGSPCQGLSVAGKRKGLNDERSGLFIEAIRIMREMREKTNEQYPKYFVWENVPGAFSSNRGQDFRAVLEEITESTIPMPENEKWAENGMVEWDGGSLEWRVLDAQWWIPQRRKRIFLVANFREESRGEILFKPEGLFGNIAAGGKTGRTITSNIQTSVDGSSRDSQHVIVYRKSGFGRWSESIIADTLRAAGGDLGGGSESLFIACNNKVRKLTPIECERLQGLPDGYTKVMFDGKIASDTKRYKALGNGMAQPCADFVLHCIACGEREALGK